MSAPNQNPAEEILRHLRLAAQLSETVGVDKDAFMAAAWSAFLESRPGLREELAERELAAQLEILRDRGMIGEA